MPAEPLPNGHVLAERFVLERVLGRGGFGIAYLGTDQIRGDAVVIKELAPEGSRRSGDGLLDLEGGTLAPAMLRQRFLDEARVLGKLNVQGVLAARASFVENGTAYYVTEHIDGSETLDEKLRRQRRFPIELALDIFLALLDVLDQVHEAGILHRDIKPSNILLAPNGDAFLIDFGSAREFLLDSAQTHTVMYTPGYAPPEQLSEKARRGPATDLFALSATLYEMLAGVPPADVAERIAGADLVPIQSLRPEVDRALANTIEAGLGLRYTDRPQSAEDVRRLLSADALAEGERSLADLDELLFRAQSFTYSKRACPNCNQPLEEARPLRRMGCPVCRRGLIRVRRIEEGVCPVCRMGGLRVLNNDDKLVVCPGCSKGILEHKKGLLASAWTAKCPKCGSTYSLHGKLATHEGIERSFQEWRRQSGRTETIVACRECKANFDVQPDGRWRQIEPPAKGKYRELYPDEWYRVAAGLEPSIGNAECDGCGADYFFEKEHLTLLDAPEDPHGFSAEYLGRLLSLEDVPWLGIGKESAQPGLICDDCGTELDHDGEYLRLVKSPNKQLARVEGQPRKLEDLHRIAQGLPTVERESMLEMNLSEAIEAAYLSGSLGFGEDEVAWRGEAVRVADGSKGVLTIDAQEISFGGLLRKWRVPRDSVVSATAEESRLSLTLSGEREPIEFDVAPQSLDVPLKSGLRRLELEAGDLAARLSGSA